MSMLGKIMFAVVPAIVMRAAAADPMVARETLREAIKIEDDRARELEGMAKHDEKLAHELDEYVKVRERYASEAAARASKLREALGGIWPNNSQADQARQALERFAKTYELFATNDREQATKRKQAEDILAAQAREGEEAVRKHRDNAAELREKLRLMDVR
jgi:hypothetical protein